MALQAEGEDGAAFRAVRCFDLCAHRFGGLFGDVKSNAVQTVLTFIKQIKELRKILVRQSVPVIGYGKSDPSWRATDGNEDYLCMPKSQKVSKKVVGNPTYSLVISAHF